ncbi:MAG: hypothetical protein HQL17_04510 [Candidatus Omnitrophica bacterium]|nr:hypothetical protein [Candidatus Omnitrophota bacterium]
MKRILVFFMGTLVALSLLEAGLRAWSFIQYKNRAISQQALTSKKEGKAYVILCLGNSYTAGAGASDGMSYPHQLQRMFRERMKDRDIIVINGGIFVQNTAELLNALPSNIDRFKPDLILLQTGQPNLWNDKNVTDYLRRIKVNLTWWGKINYRLRDLLAESRVCRLALLVLDKGNEKKPKVRQRNVGSRHEARYAAAKEFLDSIEAISFGDPRIADSQKAEEALKVFLALVQDYPTHSANYILVGKVYQFKKQYKEALDWFIKGARLAPDLTKVTSAYEAIRLLRSVKKEQQDVRVDQEIDEFLRDSRKRSFWCAEQCLYLTPEDIQRWIESDVKQIIKIIRAQGIGIILQDYPIKISQVNRTLTKVAVELEVPYINHFLLFRERLSAGEAWRDLFVPDGHCSDHGYGVMAEAVYHKIMAEGFLSRPASGK